MHVRSRLALLSAAALSTIMPIARGDTLIKLLNNSPLNTGGSWVSGAVPGPGDTLQWDNTCGLANTVALGGSFAVTGVRIVNPGGLVTISAGNVLTLGSGGFDLSNATQNLLFSASLSLSAPQTFRVAAGRTLTLGGAVANGGNTLTFAGGGTTTLTSVLSGTGGLIVNGPGTVLLSSSSPQQFSGGFTLNSGTLQETWVNTTTTSGMLPAGSTYSLAGGRLVFGTTLSATGNYTQNFTAALNLLAGDSGIERAGTAGRLAVNFSGGLSRQTGATVDYLSSSTLDLKVSGAVTASRILGGYFITNHNNFASGSGNNANANATYVSNLVSSASQNSTLTADVVANTDATVGSLRFNGTIETWLTLRGLNVVDSGGILVTNDLRANAAGIVGQSLSSGSLTSGNGQDLIIHQYNSGSTFTIAAPIVDNGATPIGLTKSGPGTVALTAANTFTGDVYLNTGVLSIVSKDNLGSPAGGAAIHFNGGTLLATGAIDLYDAAPGSHDRALILGTEGGTINIPTGGRLTVSGGISGTGALSKLGAGTLTLTAPGSFSGGTKVLGTLLVMNASGSATGSGGVTVGQAGTAGVLEGTGAIAGAVVLNPDGRLSPGSDGVGTLTLGDLTLNSGSFCDFELGGPTTGDRVIVGGAFITNGAGINLYQPGTTTPFSTPGTYPLFQYTAPPAGSLDGLSVLNPVANSTYSFSAAGNILSITIQGPAAVGIGWAKDADGSWGEPTNWFAGSLSAEATFGPVLTASHTVTLDGDRTVTALHFSTDAAIGYTLAQGTGGTLILGNGTTSGMITVAAGQHTIAAPVAAGVDNGIHFDGPATLLFTGTFNGLPPTPATLTLSGPGTVTLAGASTLDTVIVSGSRLTFGGLAASSHAAHTIAGSGVVRVESGSQLTGDIISVGSLEIAGTCTLTDNATAGSAVGFLTLAGGPSAWTGRLELNHDALVIQSADSASKAAALATLLDQVDHTAGGTAGITSSAVAADPAHKAVYAIDNALLGKTTYAGVTVDANSLLIAASYKGDGNLDRKVDVIDLGVLATNYGTSTAGGITKGDFNADGKVDVIDLGILATDYGLGTGGEAFSIGQAAASSTQSVPEPASLLVLACGIFAFQGRRSYSRG